MTSELKCAIPQSEKKMENEPPDDDDNETYIRPLIHNPNLSIGADPISLVPSFQISFSRSVGAGRFLSARAVSQKAACKLSRAKCDSLERKSGRVNTPSAFNQSQQAVREAHVNSVVTRAPGASLEAAFIRRKVSK